MSDLPSMRKTTPRMPRQTGGRAPSTAGPSLKAATPKMPRETTVTASGNKGRSVGSPYPTGAPARPAPLN